MVVPVMFSLWQYIPSLNKLQDPGDETIVFWHLKAIAILLTVMP